MYDSFFLDWLPEEGSEPTISDKPAVLATLHDARAEDRDHHRSHCPRCRATIPVSLVTCLRSFIDSPSTYSGLLVLSNAGRHCSREELRNVQELQH
jgi:hypothetical protein